MLFARLLGFYLSLTNVFCPCSAEDPALGFTPVRQEYRVERLGRFRLPESSGLAPGPKPGTFYTVQDGGNPNQIWLIDASGAILDSLSPEGTNWDWETLAGASSTIFIGDLGNNDDWRDTLGIIQWDGTGWAAYHIRYQDKNPSTDLPRTQWDSEGLYYHADSLTWFSKARASDSTRLFRIPAQPGNYQVSVQQHWQLKRGITGASVSPNGLQVAALGYGRIYFFEQKEGHLAPQGCMWWPFNGQAEAILYLNNDTLLVTNEVGKIWRVTSKH